MTSQSVGMGDKCNVIATEGHRAAASDRVAQLAHADHRRLALVRYGRNRNNVKITAVGHDLLRGDWRDRVHVGIVLKVKTGSVGGSIELARSSPVTKGCEHESMLKCVSKLPGSGRRRSL